MKTDPLIVKRFEELIRIGNGVLSTKKDGSMGFPDYVDTKASEEWGISCISFIGRVLGKDSEHYQRFEQHLEHIANHHATLRAFAVLSAAFSDYKGGYLFSTVKRIQAEIFDDFLEQSEHFLADGYHGVAAVIAGAVLEDTLRKLCARESITVSEPPKLDSMNAELAKNGVYDKLVQKKVTWLADIRNKAAHGRWTEFAASDTEEMLRAVRRFTEDYA